MTYRYAFVKWLGSAGLLLATVGCPGGDDTGDTGVTSLPTPTTGGVDTGTSSSEEESTAAVMTTMPEESTGEMDTSGGVACDPPCEAGQQCVAGQCFDPPGDTGSSSGEPPPTSSDYGPCDMCAAGEMPVGIMGLDGFCFCSPECDGMVCPAPNEGDAMPVCALGFEMGQPPTQCALVCTSTEDCPTGATCENLGMASICTHPVPA